MPTTPAVPSQKLKVIALISGGKDSLYTILHCLVQGHEVVALANLYPARRRPHAAKAGSQDEHQVTSNENEGNEEEDEDIDSHMYQTVGHTLLPFYESALGIPLFRRETHGRAIQRGTSYHHDPSSHTEADQDATGDARPADPADADETEDLALLIRDVRRARPDADALCAGAILSTYQRTRVEDVARRAGLASLAWLWMYPALPCAEAESVEGAARADPARLLRDMRAAGLSARIVKVASGGLDERALWADVCEERTVGMLERAIRRFGGSMLGEGGEFETVCLDGPRALFKGGKVEVGSWRAVGGEGGTAVVRVEAGTVRVVPREEAETEDEDLGLGRVRIPGLWDEQALGVLQALEKDESRAPSGPFFAREREQRQKMTPHVLVHSTTLTPNALHIANLTAPSPSLSAENQLDSICTTLRTLLTAQDLTPRSVTSTVLLLRTTATFAAVNAVYARLFAGAPDPPARVTVGTGRLPEEVDVALSVAVDGRRAGTRKALHVQSRSYWAPANIGPYSQGVGAPLSTEGGEMEVVHVSGQIPLVPASMELFAGERRWFDESCVLALQHLWRVGKAMGVRWWVCGVGFVVGNGDVVGERARVAGRAWKLFNARTIENGDEEEGDEQDGVDIGEKNLYRSWDGGAAATISNDEQADLPNWSIVASPVGAGSDEDEGSPCFIVQVDELPRAASIEWSGIGLTGHSKARLWSEKLHENKVSPQLEWCEVASCGTAFACFCAEDLKVLEEALGTIRGRGKINLVEIYASDGIPEDLTVESRATIIPCNSVWSRDGIEMLAAARCRIEK